MMSTTEGELDVEVPHEREDGEVRMNFYFENFIVITRYFYGNSLRL